MYSNCLCRPAKVERSELLRPQKPNYVCHFVATLAQNAWQINPTLFGSENALQADILYSALNSHHHQHFSANLANCFEFIFLYCFVLPFTWQRIKDREYWLNDVFDWYFQNRDFDSIEIIGNLVTKIFLNENISINLFQLQEFKRPLNKWFAFLAAKGQFSIEKLLLYNIARCCLMNAVAMEPHSNSHLNQITM